MQCRICTLLQPSTVFTNFASYWQNQPWYNFVENWLQPCQGCVGILVIWRARVHWGIYIIYKEGVPSTSTCLRKGRRGNPALHSSYLCLNLEPPTLFIFFLVWSAVTQFHLALNKLPLNWMFPSSFLISLWLSSPKIVCSALVGWWWKQTDWWRYLGQWQQFSNLGLWKQKVEVPRSELLQCCTQ